MHDLRRLELDRGRPSNGVQGFPGRVRDQVQVDTLFCGRRVHGGNHTGPAAQPRALSGTDNGLSRQNARQAPSRRGRPDDLQLILRHPGDRDQGRRASLYGYSRSPFFISGGYSTTSTFGSLNCSTSFVFTFWNCTSSTRDSVHSPLGPNVMSPTTVLNVWLCM